MNVHKNNAIDLKYFFKENSELIFDPFFVVKYVEFWRVNILNVLKCWLFWTNVTSNIFIYIFKSIYIKNCSLWTIFEQICWKNVAAEPIFYIKKEVIMIYIGMYLSWRIYSRKHCVFPLAR